MTTDRLLLHQVVALASGLARTSRDRQLVAIAVAHLDGDADRACALVRDHLLDHPDSPLAAWVHPAPQERP